MVHLERLNAVVRHLDDGCAQWTRRERMRLGKRLIRQKARDLHPIWVDVVDIPGALQVVMQVPEKALKTVLPDLARARRSPDEGWSGRAVIVPPKQRVEPADMVHMKVGEQDVIDSLHFGNGQRIQTMFAAVKQQPRDFLAACHLDKHRVIVAWVAEDRGAD